MGDQPVNKFYIRSEVDGRVPDFPAGPVFVEGPSGHMTVLAHTDDAVDAPVVAAMDVDCTPSKAKLLPVFRVNNLKAAPDLHPSVAVGAVSCLLDYLAVTVRQSYNHGCIYADAKNEGVAELLESCGWQPMQPAVGASSVRYVWFVPKKGRHTRARKTGG